MTYIRECILYFIEFKENLMNYALQVTFNQEKCCVAKIERVNAKELTLADV